MTCHGCGERKASLQRCEKCGMFWYCNKVSRFSIQPWCFVLVLTHFPLLQTCQTTGWVEKGHKNNYKLISAHRLWEMFLFRWDLFVLFLGFPLRVPE